MRPLLIVTVREKDADLYPFGETDWIQLAQTERVKRAINEPQIWARRPGVVTEILRIFP
jgi:hypothetical protein